MERKTRPRKPNPMLSANFMSRASFSWLDPLFAKGYRKRLEESDLYNVIEEESSQKLGGDLERAWQKELDLATTTWKPPSFQRALLQCFGFKYALIGLCFFVEEVLQLAQPVFLGLLISSLSADTTVSRQEAYLYAFAVSFCTLYKSVCHHQWQWPSWRWGQLRIKVACSYLIYRKTLRLSNSALQKTTTGQIINLLSNDIDKFDHKYYLAHYFWLAPMNVIVVTAVLWRELGPSCLPGMCYVLLLLPVQSAMGKLFGKYRSQTASRTDDRVRLMSEVLAAMRVIRMYAWEKPFGAVITKLRRREVSTIMKGAVCQGLNNGLSYAAVRVVVFLTFATYALLGNPITASKLFVAIGLYNQLQFTVAKIFPLAVQHWFESQVSIKRIQEFLMLDEIQPALVRDCDNTASDSCQSSKQTICSITAEGISASWDQETEKVNLKNVNFSVQAGQLLAVIGPVGSGKSSLLSAILGELPPVSGRISVRGRVAYTSQQPWVFSGTVRQNILFGATWDADRYKDVLNVTALSKDIESFPHGDRTLVGDRGITLSGGQKARIGLARALYRDADIYLLDDPLSAVDAKVGRHIFDRCILGALKSRICVLVTHQLQYLQQADQILVLKKGQQAAIGTYSELLQSGLDFAELLKRKEDEESSCGKDDFVEKRRESLKRSLRRRRRTSSVAVTGSGPTREREDEDHEVEEDREKGHVGWSVYKDFVTSGTGVWGVLLAILLNIAYQSLYMLTDWWFTYWANQYLKEGRNVSTSSSSINLTVNGTITRANVSAAVLDITYYVTVSAALTATVLVLSILRAVFLFYMCLSSSRSLHNQMFAAIIRVPILFFDTNPVGRILNRFSKDVGLLDHLLPLNVAEVIQFLMMTVGVFLLAGIVNPWVFIPSIPIMVTCLVVIRYYLATSRDIKRLEGTTRSPVFSHLSATLQGLWTVRACNAQHICQEAFSAHLDLQSEAVFLFLAINRWLALRLDVLVALFVVVVAFISVFAAESLDGGLVGLSLSYAIYLTNGFQYAVRLAAEVETLMTSAERVLTYARMEPEAPLQTAVTPPPGWPQHGSIRLEGASFAYTPGGPDVLTGLHATIHGGEKIGIVGRTGAGKSSLVQMLFRMAEPRGNITIDGMDIAGLGLHTLRTNLSVIPQDPVLFSGTLRKNLDPFEQFSDQQLWRVLEEVQLNQVVADLPGKLETELLESGSNLSVGQRQLMCLARAMLRRNKILIIDEATANVDPRTDQLIQETIRVKFRSCTVMTIAHRLHTIIDSYKIMVISDGLIQEFDEPFWLLKNRQGHLSRLLRDLGEAEAGQLRAEAQRCFYSRHPNAEVTGL
ncbi:multidrug resistance-associated protein 4-like isoform X1 [Branchiostoma floridae]|uniref:Multidrug resistance-associated protein 4-like isoform X1 n=1 Tax=Branchiostoma floridae TaxID=7739 RepID=A0A9J7L002_BRAFL|nr:multidrug resistance-associated protein 4-like isoform X1 [Branchiostoma floridae]